MFYYQLNSNRYKTLSLEGHLEEYPHFGGLIYNLKDLSDTCKNFYLSRLYSKLSSKDNGKENQMFLLSTNVLIMIKDSTKDLINAVVRIILMNY